MRPPQRRIVVPLVLLSTDKKRNCIGKMFRHAANTHVETQQKQELGSDCSIRIRFCINRVSRKILRWAFRHAETFCLVLNKLQTLSDEDSEKVREAFIKHCHTRFMKYFFPHLLFGHKKDYVEEIKKASLEKLAHLIKVCGFLLQTKVYLFWRRSEVASK